MYYKSWSIKFILVRGHTQEIFVTKENYLANSFHIQAKLLGYGFSYYISSFELFTLGYNHRISYVTPVTFHSSKISQRSCADPRYVFNCWVKYHTAMTIKYFQTENRNSTELTRNDRYRVYIFLKYELMNLIYIFFPDQEVGWTEKKSYFSLQSLEY